MMTRLFRLVALTTAALLALVLAPASPGTAAGDQDRAALAASSGTLVFLKGHNVWMARADGTGQSRVTGDGTASAPYLSPSMDNGGVIVAIQSGRLVRMRQNGQALHRFRPPALPDTLGHLQDDFLVYASVSPDGAKVAYTYAGSTCDPTAGCGFRGVTGITDATRPTGPAVHGSNYYAQPSWVGNARIMVHGGYGSHMMLDPVGPAAAFHWFDDDDIADPELATDLGDGEVSPDGSMLAAVRGYGHGTHIAWYAVNGSARTGTPAVPTPLCVTSTLDGLASPTWAADASALAWEEPDGIWLKRDPRDCVTVQPRLVIPGGSAPDWSPAALDPGPLVFRLVRRPVASGKLRVGKVLKATTGRWSPAPARVGYQWLRNGKTVKGATKARYRLRRADRRDRISVRVTVSRSGYRAAKAVSASRRVR